MGAYPSSRVLIQPSPVDSLSTHCVRIRSLSPQENLSSITQQGCSTSNSNVTELCSITSERLKFVDHPSEVTMVYTISAWTVNELQRLLHMYLSLKHSKNVLASFSYSLISTNSTSHPYRQYIICHGERLLMSDKVFLSDYVTTSSDNDSKIDSTSGALSSDTDDVIPSCRLEGLSLSQSNCLAKPPVWFIIENVTAHLMSSSLDTLKQYPPFASVISECYETLPSNVNNLLSTDVCKSPCMCDINVLSSTAVSIALYEVLREVGISPNSIVAGSAIGYLVLCYLDGTLTLEQTMKLAYVIAKVWTRSDIRECAVANVSGLTSTEFATMCPDNVFVSCVYENNSVSVTGEKEAIISLVSKLEHERLCKVKLISSACLPLQTPLVMPALDQDVLSEMRSIIGCPKTLSTQCVVAIDTDNKELECSVELLIFALTQPVNFARVLERIPNNSVILELSSTESLYQTLQQANSSDVTVIPVLDHDGLNLFLSLMQAIGECHNAGLNVNPLKLLDTEERPQTLELATDGDNVYSDCPCTHYCTTKTSPMYTYPSSLICTATDLSSIFEYKMKFNNYVVNGVAIVPIGYPLMCVLQSLAEYENILLMELAVSFEDVTFHNMIELNVEEDIRVCVMFSTLSGHFEVSVNDRLLIATGRLCITQQNSDNRVQSLTQTSTNYSCNKEKNKENDNTAACTTCTSLKADITTTSECVENSAALGQNVPLKDDVVSTTVMVLSQKDMYKELSLKGYSIGECFHVLSKTSDLLLNECDLQLSYTTYVELTVALIESAIQMGILQHTLNSCNSVLYPSFFQSLQINPQVLASATKVCASSTLRYSAPMDTYYIEGYSLTGLKFTVQPRRLPKDIMPRIERYTFQPYFQYILDKQDPSSSELKTLIDVVIENTRTETLSVLNVVNDEGEHSVSFGNELCAQVKEFTNVCLIEVQDIVWLSELLNEKEQANVVTTITGDAKLYDLIVLSSVGTSTALSTLLSGKQSVLLNKLSPGGFVLIKEQLCMYEDSQADTPQKSISKIAQNSNLHCVARRHFSNTEMPTDSESVLLLYHHVPVDIVSNTDFAVVNISAKDKGLPWIKQLKGLLKTKVTPCKRIYCVSEFEPDCPSGILGLMNCLRLESYIDTVRCVYLVDSKLEKDEFFTSKLWHQIKAADLLMNVIKNNQIGSYRHLPLVVNNVHQSPHLPTIKPTTIKKESLDIPSQMFNDYTVVDGQDLTQEEVVFETNVYSSGSTTVHPTSSFTTLDCHQLASTGPLFQCHPHKTYIITGGLGGVGLELAVWLAEHGARRLILTSRSGVKTAYQARKLKLLKADGVDVVVSSLDVSQESQAHELMYVAVNNFRNDSREIGGIFHLAVVMRDCKFESQTAKRFQAVMSPKSTGALNLHRALCRLSTLGHNVKQTLFVVFSSTCSGLGHATQSSYGYTNSIMERLCEMRQEQGLHGLAIQWGAIGDVGVLHNMMKGQEVKSIGGTRSQPLHSCLTSLEAILGMPFPTPPVISCYVPALMEMKEAKVDSPVCPETGVFVKEMRKEPVLCTSSVLESKVVIQEDVAVSTGGVLTVSSEASVSTCDSQSDLVNVQERSDE